MPGYGPSPRMARASSTAAIIGALAFICLISVASGTYHLRSGVATRGSVRGSRMGIGKIFRRQSRRASSCSVASSMVGAPAPADKKRVTVVGGTGYIGKFVVKELAERGYDVTAIVREKSGIGGKSSLEDVRKGLPEGVNVIAGDVTDKNKLDQIMPETDVLVSCLASRTGGIADSWLIDYEATKNTMDSGKEKGAKQFVLLSAICVQKPLLEFQRAKLRFEEDLMASGLQYSIVRPTAFFKSLAGQIENVKNGGPYVMFGDGQLAACKPISERERDCITNPELQDKILPIGGPGEALTPLQQADILFKAAEVEPNTIK
ncbi:hypothetical protein AAMO2058_001505000, partial [Amorphochlora amoebiformis]